MHSVPDILPAALGGRCANGYERDQGHRVHAVPESDSLRSNGYCLTPALCGAKPGARSVGWSLRAASAITCPKCAARLQRAAVRQLAGTLHPEGRERALHDARAALVMAGADGITDADIPY